MFNNLEKNEINLEINSLSRIADIIDKNYYSFLNFFDESGLEPRDLEKFGIDILKIKNFIDKKLSDSLEKINVLAKEKNLKISFDSSLIDVLGNSVVSEISVAKNIINKLKDEKIEDLSDLSDGQKKILTLLKNSLEDIPYYLDKICNNEGVLEKELTNRVGYLEKYKDYFLKNKTGDTLFPTGTKKISYLRLFDEVEKGELEREEIEDLIDKLNIDVNILDRDKFIK